MRVFILFIFLISTSIKARTIVTYPNKLNKKFVKGNYIGFVGKYSTKLKIKRSMNFKERCYDVHGMVIRTGKWTLKNDTLILHYNGTYKFGNQSTKFTIVNGRWQNTSENKTSFDQSYKPVKRFWKVNNKLITANSNNYN